MNKKYARFAWVPALLIACNSALAAGLQLSSTDIKSRNKLPEAQVFNGFGCSGGNTSPALQWQSGPKDTRSYAVTVYDPDAPTGSGWWHWVVYNIPAGVTSLPTGAGQAGGAKLPAGAKQGRTDYGTYAFGGACPPEGDEPHRYIFTVHALKADKLDVPEDASAALIGYMINANRLAKSQFTAKYGR